MTPILFAHIGDVHLQSGHPRNEDRLKSFDQIVDDLHALPQLAATLIPGDLFHRLSTVEDRNALSQRLVDLAAAAPVCLTRGNHDAVGDLEIFAKLKTRWPVYVFTRPGVTLVPLATGDIAAIAHVPYPDKAGLVAAGVPTSDVSQTAVELLDVIFIQLAHELATATARVGAVPLFMGHFNVRGAVVASGQPQIGHEQEVDRQSLQRLGAVYCALNHIHVAQEVGAGVFAGSIAPMDYGETDAKSYVVVTAARSAAGWTATWDRRALDVAPMFHVDGILTREGFAMRATPDSATFPSDWTGCDVRVRVSYHASERAVLDFAAIAPQFAGALRLKVETTAIADRELRAPAVAAATTIPAKLAAMRQLDQLPASIAEKVDALQRGEDVLSDVSARLKAIEQPERATVAA